MFHQDAAPPYFTSDRAKVALFAKRGRRLTCDAAADDTKEIHSLIDKLLDGGLMTEGQIRTGIMRHAAQVCPPDHKDQVFDTMGEGRNDPDGAAMGPDQPTDDVGASSTVNGKTTGYQITTDKMRRFWQEQEKHTASLVNDIRARNAKFYRVSK